MKMAGRLDAGEHLEHKGMGLGGVTRKRGGKIFRKVDEPGVRC